MGTCGRVPCVSHLIHYDSRSQHCRKHLPDQNNACSSDVIYQVSFKWTREFHRELRYSRSVSCKGHRQPSISWRWIGTGFGKKRNTPPVPLMFINSLLLVGEKWKINSDQIILYCSSLMKTDIYIFRLSVWKFCSSRIDCNIVSFVSVLHHFVIGIYI
jgi:hypothetical protein